MAVRFQQIPKVLIRATAHNADKEWKRNAMSKEVKCDYCQRPAALVSGLEIYPHKPNLYEKNFWHCVSCDAYVGVHPKTNRPLGSLADRDLREWRRRAHVGLDPLWQRDHYGLERQAVYDWLALELEIPVKDCHIGMFDAGMCQRVIGLCFWRRKHLNWQRQAEQS